MGALENPRSFPGSLNDPLRCSSSGGACEVWEVQRREGVGDSSHQLEVLLHLAPRRIIGDAMVSEDLLVEHELLLPMWPDAPTVVVDHVSQNQPPVAGREPFFDLEVDDAGVFPGLPGPLKDREGPDGVLPQQTKYGSADAWHPDPLQEAVWCDRSVSVMQVEVLRSSLRDRQHDRVVPLVVLEEELGLEFFELLSLHVVWMTFEIGTSRFCPHHHLDRIHLDPLGDEGLWIVAVVNEVGRHTMVDQQPEDVASCSGGTEGLPFELIRLSPVAGCDGILGIDVHQMRIVGVAPDALGLAFCWLVGHLTSLLLRWVELLVGSELDLLLLDQLVELCRLETVVGKVLQLGRQLIIIDGQLANHL